ncbi:solute carrier family 45 member 3 [Corythoichthys intestinalis]|uniref:solute carrier family 45 member 3 n=1 Tax=Corythoichthys intestinalis TaxID=161448 RepID=UPI0025A61120|nr:solute carrier family 45 member 3 [Corythoichthys intestinalis]XP_057693883.1 solute carrier family 45 member 3 [Corythoichthys intestinalis]XP_057693884.1 solute carrier family 45 member 3 [Corythoichthys intestinalis]XP_061812935.1 solute carrier family 45 member 3-like [Nerophis lumbriciformis]
MPGWRTQWHLFLLNSLTCALEICVAAGITYVPPLLLEAGVEERYMTMVLGIGPVLGLLFIPLIGSASDNCNSSYGRRRPFIWLLSLGVLLALFIIPYADILAAHFAWGGRTFQVAFLILGVGLLDFCGQVCFTPLEALLSDLYRDGKDCNQAFAMFSFMVSLGGCVGYLLPAFDWSHSLLSVYLGGQDQCLFFLLILIFIPSVLITMKVSKEPSSAIVGSVGAVSLLESGAGAMEATQCGVPRSCCYLLKCKFRLLKSGPLLCVLKTCWSMTPAIYRSYCHVPRVMWQLCVAQLCSWMAVMSFMLFFTVFVAEGLYGGDPSAVQGSVARHRYDEGIRMGSLGLFLQCATSTFFSMVMSRMVQCFGSRLVYLSSMVSFTAFTLVICLSKSVLLVTIMAALTGYAYAALQTLPYTLTCHYHKEKKVYMPKRKTKITRKNDFTSKRDYLTSSEEVGLLNDKADPSSGNVFFSQDAYYQNGSTHNSTESEEPQSGYEDRGVGLDFAILDSTFLLSQVIPTLLMGTIVQLAQSVTAYIACSVILGIVAIYLANHIVFDRKDLKGCDLDGHPTIRIVE